MKIKVLTFIKYAEINRWGGPLEIDIEGSKSEFPLSNWAIGNGFFWTLFKGADNFWEEEAGEIDEEVEDLEVDPKYLNKNRYNNFAWKDNKLLA